MKGCTCYNTLEQLPKYISGENIIMHAVQKQVRRLIHYLVYTLDNGVLELETATLPAALVLHVHLARGGHRWRRMFSPTAYNFATF